MWKRWRSLPLSGASIRPHNAEGLLFRRRHYRQSFTPLLIALRQRANVASQHAASDLSQLRGIRAS